MPFSCVLGGLLIEKFGRKSVHVYVCPITIIGFLILGFANSYKLLLAGRFIVGFCSGLTAASCMIYVAETSSPKYRGFLLSLLISGLSVGMLIVHFLGTFIAWHITAFISNIFSVIGFIIIFFVPESPVWLARKKKYKEAENSFMWYRGCTAKTQEEMTQMIECQQRGQDNKFELIDYIKCFGIREFYAPFIIVNVYMLTTQFSGVNVIPYYTVAIMNKTIGSNSINSYFGMLILDIARVLNAILSSFLTKTMSRRSLTMLSGFGTASSVLILAVLLSFDNSLKYVSYIKLLAFISYISFITVGLLPLPWTMAGELFSPKYRGLGGGLTASVAFIGNFATVKFAPMLFNYFGSVGAFTVFGICAAAGTTYLYFYLPETKDRTLEEIENYFKTRKEINANDNGKLSGVCL